MNERLAIVNPSRSFLAMSRVAVSSAVLCVLFLSGCGGGSGGSTSSSAPAPTTPVVSTVTNPAIVAKNAYVCDPLNETVDVYAADINGLAALTASYPAASGQAVAGVAVDGTGNVYVAGTGSVAVYAPGSSTPSRTFSVPTGWTITGGYGFGGPMTIDAAGDIYVTANGGGTTTNEAIYVFGPAATGAATPLRTISGALTQLQNPTQLALDAAGDLYAVMQNGLAGSLPTLVMYAAGATGNVAPTLITSSQYTPDGVALDSAGNIYITSGGTSTSTQATGIYEFAAGSKAGATPMRSITGSNVELNEGNFLQVDTAGNLFVSGFFGSQSYSSGEDIYVYGATQSGNVAPASALLTYRSAESCFVLK